MPNRTILPIVAVAATMGLLSCGDSDSGPSVEEAAKERRRAAWEKSDWLKRQQEARDAQEAAADREFDEAFEKKVAESKRKASVINAMPSVSPADILIEYGQNELSADAKMKGKLIKIRGVVDKVGEDILGSPYFTFDIDAAWRELCAAQGIDHESREGKTFRRESIPAFRGVQCFSSQVKWLASLKPGKEIVVVGVCDGMTMNVLIRETRRSRDKRR